MSTIKVDNLQTTSGAGLFPARAWVNFDGTGTVAIRDDGNVSSITDYGAGNYGVNFSTSLSSTNYATSAHANGEGTSYSLNSQTAIYPSGNGGTNPTASFFRIVTGNSANASTKQDRAYIHVMALM